MDTSALLAALVADHEHHALARPHLANTSAISAIVLAECFAVLRRTFGQPAGTATALLGPWATTASRVLPTSAATVAAVFGRAVELDLGGSIHDALIAQTHVEHDLPLVTLDGRQHRLALALGARSTYLLT